MLYDREFLTGTMSVLILSLLGDRAMHAFEILHEADLRSARQFQLREGTIYPPSRLSAVSRPSRSIWRRTGVRAEVPASPLDISDVSRIIRRLRHHRFLVTGAGALVAGQAVYPEAQSSPCDKLCGAMVFAGSLGRRENSS
jgi:hypothetical protein